MQQQQDRWEPDMRARQGMVDRYEINVLGEVYGGMRERWCYLLDGSLGSDVHRVACTVSTTELRTEFGTPGIPYRCARDFNVEAPT